MKKACKAVAIRVDTIIINVTRYLVCNNQNHMRAHNEVIILFIELVIATLFHSDYYLT